MELAIDFTGIGGPNILGGPRINAPNCAILDN